MELPRAQEMMVGEKYCIESHKKKTDPTIYKMSDSLLIICPKTANLGKEHVLPL